MAKRTSSQSTLQKRVDDQPHISREMVREAEAIFHSHLRHVGLKHTGQRDTILRTFLDTRDHLSTDELYRLVKKQDEGIGFTTVYRTLKLLSECGLASEVAFNDGVARYEHQYNRRNHHHMVCTECGSSVEFFSNEHRTHRARDRPQEQVHDHPAYLSDIRHMRSMPEEAQADGGLSGAGDTHRGCSRCADPQSQLVSRGTDSHVSRTHRAPRP